MTAPPVSIQTEMWLAARRHLLACVLATTGSATFEKTTIGYKRTVMDEDNEGFLVDGFVPGMEITPDEFTANPIDIVTGVTATELLTLNTHSAEGSDSDRSLVAKPPRFIQYGTRAVDVPPDRGYWAERWLGGPTRGLTTFSRGNMLVQTEPLYQVTVFGRIIDDDLVVTRSADSIARHFGSGTALAVGDRFMDVPQTPLAAIGPIGRTDDGRPAQTVTIALRLFHRL